MVYRIREVVFTKSVSRTMRISTIMSAYHPYVDLKKTMVRFVSLLTNDVVMEPEEFVSIYRKICEIELLFKLLKQNFPL